jgi:ubiquinone/menaquinone biosynthesis C-methylase UbiE
MRHTCPWWFGHILACPLRRLVQDPHAILRPFVRPGMSVLEVGPGMGYFTPELARLAGESGSLTVADVQQKMLDGTARRLARAGCSSRARFLKCGSDDFHFGLSEFDFVLLFFMVHEVGDRAGFFYRISDSMKPGGAALLAEPFLHVPARGFVKELLEASGAGLVVVRDVRIRAARAALLSRPGDAGRGIDRERPEACRLQGNGIFHPSEGGRR